MFWFDDVVVVTPMSSGTWFGTCVHGQRKQRRDLLRRSRGWGHGANLAWGLERDDRNRRRN
jgi:hypothetical protein